MALISSPSTNSCPRHKVQPTQCGANMVAMDIDHNKLNSTRVKKEVSNKPNVV